MPKRLQNSIAESRFLFPFMGVAIVVVLTLADGFSNSKWLSALLLAVTTYLLAELNNRQTLLRIYSRTVSCTFIALLCMMPSLAGNLQFAVVALSITLFFTLTFTTYHTHWAVGSIYLAFLIISIGSLFFVHILYMVPPLWAVMIFYIYSLDEKTFSASLLGLITPYWFIIVGVVYAGQISLFTEHFRALITFCNPADIRLLSRQEIVVFAFVALLYVTGVIHYLRSGFRDKIRTRMFYNAFMLIATIALIGIVLQPALYYGLMGILAVCVSPLVAHFVALTHTRFTNIYFILISIAITSFTIYNLWIGI